MANEELGTLAVKVSMDGSGFQNGIAGINKSLAVVKSEFKLASAQLGEFGTGSDQLKLKSESLNKQIDLQKQKVVALESAFKTSADKKGLDSKATQDLEIKMNGAKTALVNMETELAKTNKEIEVQTSNWTKLGTSFDNAGAKMKDVGAGFTDVGKRLSMGLTAPILGAMGASANLASDLNESINKVDVAFGGSADGVKDWSNTTLKSFGLAKGTALDMAATYGDMATSMQLSTSAAADMGKELVGRAADLTSYKNISISVANTALNGIFTGETESLKQLGVVMTQANLNAFALANGIEKTVQEMTQSEQVQLRYAYVMEATKNAEGDFAKTREGAANSAREFQESLKELGATMGQYILPVITPIIQKLSETAQAFGELSPEAQKTILVVAGVTAAIGPLMLVSGGLITAFGTISGVFGSASLAIGATSTAATVATPAIAGLGTTVATTAATAAVALGPWLALAAAIAGTMYLVNGAVKENGVVLQAQNGPWMQTAAYMQGAAKATDAATEATQKNTNSLRNAAGAKQLAAIESKKTADALGDLAAGFGSVGGAAKSVADSIKSALDASVGRLTLSANIIKAKYDLWKESIGQAATESEKLRAQLQSQVDQMGITSNTISVLQAAYEKMKAAKGETAMETQNLVLQLIKEQTAQAELKNQIDATNASIQAQNQLQTRMSSKGSTSTYDPTTGISWSTDKNGDTVVIDAKGNRTVQSNSKPASSSWTAEIRANMEKLVPKFASGTPYVPRDMLAYIHEGERIIPASQNKMGGQGITIVNQGTIVGSNGMEEFANIISRKIGTDYGYSVGGAY